MIVFVSPHNDDETLFGAFTLMQVKPLVLIVSDSFIQQERGDNITSEQRRDETKRAMSKLGCEVRFLGIPDNQLSEFRVLEALAAYQNCEAFIPTVYEQGNKHHNLIGEACKKTFASWIEYQTYEQGINLRATGKRVPHSDKEMALKKEALNCYQSQINLGATRPYFETDNEEYYGQVKFRLR